VPPTGTKKKNNQDSLWYVWTPAGKFKMGCVPTDTECQKHPDNENPQHEVVIEKGFWLGQTEVQRDAYVRFARETRRRQPDKTPANKKDSDRGDLPVVGISWDEASEYCKWAGGRLPTEAEWEYAARAGKPDQIYPFYNDQSSRKQANFAGQNGRDIWDFVAPAAQFDPNPWALYDMAGNVFEWVSDFYSKTYYRECVNGVTDPQGPTPRNSSDQHVQRGGSWSSKENDQLRISYRMSERNYGGTRTGFRCVLNSADVVINELDELTRKNSVVPTGHRATVER